MRPINEYYIDTLILEKKIYILIENAEENGRKERIKLVSKILNGEIRKADVAKELERISNQYGDGCFNSYEVKRQSKPWGRKNLKELEILSASGAASKEFYLHMAEVADKVYARESNIKKAKKIILATIFGVSVVGAGVFVAKKIEDRRKKLKEENKNKEQNINNKNNIKFIGSTDKYNTGDTDPKNRTFPYNNIEDAAFSIIEAYVSKDYCDNGYIILNKPAGLKTKVYIYKVDNSNNYEIISIEFSGTVEECIKEYNIPIKK